LKITRCTTAVVEANYDYTFVRIYADNGLYGTGECFFAPGLTAETALWDLVGKSLGVPVYQLLGGRMRDEVRVYADCHAGDNIESWNAMLVQRRPAWLAQRLAGMPEHEERFEPAMYARRAQQMVAAGFDALKFDIDSIVVYTGEELHRPLKSDEIGRMVACVAAAREGAGPQVDLAVDCHWRFAPSEALRICRALQSFNLFWLEDPCPPENWRDMAELRQLAGCPILTGENLNRRHGFWDLIQQRAVDLIAPDLQKCGGLLEGKRIGELAEMQGIRFAPHNIASPLGTLASAHVCITLPNFAALEFHGFDVPFWNELLVRSDMPGPLIQQGRIRLSEAPGLGGELNEPVARQYAKPGEPFFE
jgi:gluconate/galactonate dehydratase